MHAVSNVGRPFAVIALAALVSVSGCGVDPNELDEESTLGTEEAGGDEEAGAISEDTASVEQGVDFYSCSCLNPSQVLDCRAPTTCTKYVRQGTATYFCRETLRAFTCPKYVPKVCRKSGFVKGSLACCSGRAAMRAGKLRCL